MSIQPAVPLERKKEPSHTHDPRTPISSPPPARRRTPSRRRAAGTRPAVAPSRHRNSTRRRAARTVPAVAPNPTPSASTHASFHRRRNSTPRRRPASLLVPVTAFRKWICSTIFVRASPPDRGGGCSTRDPARKREIQRENTHPTRPTSVPQDPARKHWPTASAGEAAAFHGKEEAGHGVVHPPLPQRGGGPFS